MYSRGGNKLSIVRKPKNIKDSVPINCSCPNCHTLLVLPLTINEEQVNVIDKVQEATGIDLNVLGVYTFDGHEICSQCGRFIMASLTVSAHDTKHMAG